LAQPHSEANSPRCQQGRVTAPVDFIGLDSIFPSVFL
jgi:hypothetical protein